jgi:hypothetical protein
MFELVSHVDDGRREPPGAEFAVRRHCQGDGNRVVTDDYLGTLRDLCDRFAGGWHHAVTLGGELDDASGAPKEVDTKVCLELFDALTECSGSEFDCLRGTTKVQMFRCGNETLKVVDRWYSSKHAASKFSKHVEPEQQISEV